MHCRICILLLSVFVFALNASCQPAQIEEDAKRNQRSTNELVSESQPVRQAGGMFSFPHSPVLSNGNHRVDGPPGLKGAIIHKVWKQDDKKDAKNEKSSQERMLNEYNMRLKAHFVVRRAINDTASSALATSSSVFSSVSSSETVQTPSSSSQGIMSNCIEVVSTLPQCWNFVLIEADSVSSTLSTLAPSVSISSTVTTSPSSSPTGSLSTFMSTVMNSNDSPISTITITTLVIPGGASSSLTTTSPGASGLSGQSILSSQSGPTSNTIPPQLQTTAAAAANSAVNLYFNMHILEVFSVLAVLLAF